jgi:hypothetical protein
LRSLKAIRNESASKATATFTSLRMFTFHFIFISYATFL